MNFTCPVCGYAFMDAPPKDYEICSCCGTEFGNDDEFMTHAELRSRWIHKGAPWFYGHPPMNWNPWWQLTVVGHGQEIRSLTLSTQTASTTATKASDISRVQFQGAFV
jgi:hypothetical protein